MNINLFLSGEYLRRGPSDVESRKEARQRLNRLGFEQFVWNTSVPCFVTANTFAYVFSLSIVIIMAASRTKIMTVILKLDRDSD